MKSEAQSQNSTGLGRATGDVRRGRRRLDRSNRLICLLKREDYYILTFLFTFPIILENLVQLKEDLVLSNLYRSSATLFAESV